MTNLSREVYDHITGAATAAGFYIFKCKCKHQWAMPATDSRLWLSGDVADSRWVPPRMDCPQCGKTTTSNDDQWCPDPNAVKERAIRAFVEANSPPYIGGILPSVSWAICPDGIAKLHVKVCHQKVHTPNADTDMTTYSLFDADGREYVPSRIIPNTTIRSDGVICWWVTDAVIAAKISVDYTGAVEWFKESPKAGWSNVEEPNP